MATEKTHYVYSALASDVAYVPHFKGGDGMMTPDMEKKVVIKGGANVADGNFITPIGVSTSITDDELEMLKSNSVFQKHVAAGHIKVLSKRAPTEKVALDMNSNDQSRPRTPADYQESKEPITGGGKKTKASGKREVR